jgi:hypothetical protein
MTLHQTPNMAFDTDFQFIMGTILSQKQDSPLCKALKKAGITNVGGITSLTNQAIDRLKYQDDSSGTPANKELLGHGYQQLIHCFNPFVLIKNDQDKPIHGDWQNLTMTGKFQEFQTITFALYTMTQAPAWQVLIQGSLHTILIERLIFVASITMRSLSFLLSLLELWRDLNGGMSFL